MWDTRASQHSSVNVKVRKLSGLYNESGEFNLLLQTAKLNVNEQQYSDVFYPFVVIAKKKKNLLCLCQSSEKQIWSIIHLETQPSVSSLYFPQTRNGRKLWNIWGGVGAIESRASSTEACSTDTQTRWWKTQADTKSVMPADRYPHQLHLSYQGIIHSQKRWHKEPHDRRALQQSEWTTGTSPGS